MKIYTAKTIPSVRTINAAPKRFVGASLFAGCGGASLGARLAGIDMRYANEFIPIAAKTYKANAPSATVDTTDIRKVSAESVLKACGVKRGELDYLDGSPPCSSFSVASRQKGADNYRKPKRYSEGVFQRTDDLFDHFIRIVKGTMPRVFVAENVPGLANSINRGLFLSIHSRLTRLGYKVTTIILDASQLGVPQQRKRLIFIGVRNDQVVKPGGSIIPRPIARELTVRECFPHIVRLRTAAGVSQPNEKTNRVVVKRSYIDASIPSPTITATDATNTDMARMSCGGWIETIDGERRKYTIEELKIVFGFPKDFKLLGTFEQQWERLGRTHIPLQSYYIAATIIENVLELGKHGRGQHHSKR